MSSTNGNELHMIEEIDVLISHDDLIDLSQGKTIWANTPDTQVSIRLIGGKCE